MADPSCQVISSIAGIWWHFIAVVQQIFSFQNRPCNQCQHFGQPGESKWSRYEWYGKSCPLLSWFHDAQPKLDLKHVYWFFILVCPFPACNQLLVPEMHSSFSFMVGAPGLSEEIAWVVGNMNFPSSQKKKLFRGKNKWVTVSPPPPSIQLPQLWWH